MLAALSPILWDLTPGESDLAARLKQPLFWFFMAVVCIAILVTGIQGSQSIRRSTEVRRGLTTFNHSLGDTVRSLDVLLDSDRGERDRRAFFKSIVSESKSLIALELPRICVYELDGREGETGEELYLRLVAAGGRVDPPRSRFESSTPYGRAAIEVAQGTLHKCIDDPRPGKSPIVVDRDPDALWQSFMMVPLRVNRQPRGLLTIDTTRSTSFTSDHIAVALTIKSFIEIGMKDVADAAENPQQLVDATLRRLEDNNRGDPAATRFTQAGGAAETPHRGEPGDRVSEHALTFESSEGVRS